jgi:DNA-binding response OmpR family regulator
MVPPPFRIIVVDDEDVIASTTAVILCQHGFNAVGFKDPLDAPRHCKETGLDLLLSDVMMPGMSGVDLASEIQKLHPSSKVLLFSGVATTNDLSVEARKHGDDFSVLGKPIHPKEMVKLIRSVLA